MKLTELHVYNTGRQFRSLDVITAESYNVMTYVCIAMRLLLLQVAEKYIHLVTSINNADTLVTLIVPSVVIIFCNCRISVALSQFYHDRQLMSAQERRVERTSGEAAAAAPAAVSQASFSSSHSRSLRQQTSITFGQATTADNAQMTAFGNGSFNQLQMKVRLWTIGTWASVI